MYEMYASARTGGGNHALRTSGEKSFATGGFDIDIWTIKKPSVMAWRKGIYTYLYYKGGPKTKAKLVNVAPI